MKQKLLPIVLCLLFIAGIAGLVFLYFHSPYEQRIAVCPIFQLTGIQCPGCGMTRALYCLLHLDLEGVFRENLFLFALPFAIYLALAELLPLCGFRFRLPVPHIRMVFVYLLFGAWIVYGFGRNFF